MGVLMGVSYERLVLDFIKSLKVADCFGVSVDYLLNGEIKNPRTKCPSMKK